MENGNGTSGADGGAAHISPYCGDMLVDLHDVYVHYHGYASLLVCAFGSVANVLNIAVLTRKEMVSPTNAILTGLAVADLLVMVEYVPFAYHMYLRPTNYPRADRFSYNWSLFVLLHSDFSQAFHTISIWLTVTLAVWRYVAVVHPQLNRIWCRMETTLSAIALGYLVCPIICIPSYLSFNLFSRVETLDANGNRPTAVLQSALRRANNGTDVHNAHVIGGGGGGSGAVGGGSSAGAGNGGSGPLRNVTLYYVNVSDLATSTYLADINFWVYSVVIKILPCVALTVLSLRLICALLEAKRRRAKLTGSGRKSADKERQTDRTTRMLLAVLMLFLITEFPQGILGLLTLLLGKRFFQDCYQNMGEVMDMLALVNSAINFILYCVMSRQFRNTFSLLFLPSWISKVESQALSHGNPTTTQVTQV
ncbi:G-protein coupled receptor dmsr-1-like isoform X1 [Aphis gossypii]|nr:G-protein coupled receptor dmsr-1-like isoform X1 [Aphis gossypii]XP_027849063.1 G-protein coupled receptor dmsr-1-like isoform X1 [Aphis gossypii]XP_027849064.1 G-protein coupled receptor dmsr-1-like isoform X1 [Aphis gossypii]XP_050056608.1 G-protein coupled receptor dmsr-1-like isoform X1 [Aphis gossypii]XP_050056609.1 G-protein coupled receptor dmsr-1-like isoform X1 [Aphis gossypii]XP_050056610.1 G-protein coupled receptor dmsr-1-like isoform X1 [Aphis gossypii]XP_050056611.1 G-protei